MYYSLELIINFGLKFIIEIFGVEFVLCWKCLWRFFMNLCGVFRLILLWVFCWIIWIFFGSVFGEVLCMKRFFGIVNGWM